MLTTDDLTRLGELVCEAKAVLNGSDTAQGDPEAARRRVTRLLEEAIRLCRSAHADGGRPRVDDGRPQPQGRDGSLAPTRPEVHR